MACGSPKVSAPFKKLPAMFRQMIHSRHLPVGFIFPDDPSHMRVEDARSFLNFIVERQKSDPSDTFEFHHWLNEQSELTQGPQTETPHEDLMRKGDRGRNSDKRTRQQSGHVEGESHGLRYHPGKITTA